MAEKFNGTWKLVAHDENLRDFYLSTGTKVEEVDMLMKFDDVNADFRYKITVNGDDVVTVGSHNGTEIQTERFKLGVKRQEQFESISGSVLTTVKDGVWTDYFERPGHIDSIYEFRVEGNKMTLKCYSSKPDGVVSYKEFVKM